jgi:hypothetical protein
MILAMKGLRKAFLMWQEQHASLEALGQETNWEMYQRKRKMLYRNNLIFFVWCYLGIFLSHEVIMLVDIPVQKKSKNCVSSAHRFIPIHLTLLSLTHSYNSGESICDTIIIFDPHIGVQEKPPKIPKKP